VIIAIVLVSIMVRPCIIEYLSELYSNSKKQVVTLTTTCSAYRKQLVDGSLAARGVHNMLQLASYFMGGEESREFGPASRSQVVGRSAGTGVAVREPVGAGSTSAGVGPVVAMLTVDSPASEATDQVHAVADASTTQESSSGGTSQVSGMARVPVSKPLKLEKYNPDKTSFETFMAKVVNLRKFNQWTEVEECALVRDALEGSAADVLWELGTDATSTLILEILKNVSGMHIVPNGTVHFCQVGISNQMSLSK